MEPSFDLNGLEELHSILHGDVPAPAPLPVLHMADYSMIPEVGDLSKISFILTFAPPF